MCVQWRRINSSVTLLKFFKQTSMMSAHEGQLENNFITTNIDYRECEAIDLCHLMENDFHCGQIFYNENSRLLKFSCIYCKKIFYDVKHYCEHLSEHIGDGTSEIIEEVNVSEYTTDELVQTENDCESAAALDENENAKWRVKNIIEPNPSSYSFRDYFVDTNYSESIPSYESGKVSKEKKSTKKKITTIKVIAVKNRIADLYKKIKLEERKRSGYSFNEPLCKKTCEDNDSSNFKCTSETSQLIQKIIGETIITHIPDAFYNAKTHLNIENEYQDVDRRTVCPACGERFRNAFSLAIHKRKHYLESTNEIKLAHKCSHCNQLFNKISEMKNHLQQIHYPEGFICKICDKKLTSISLLESHMRKVHLNKPFNCKKCGKNFENREIYDAHVISHDNNECYKCRICGRKYTCESSLMLHLQRHKERKPQCCVVCNKMTMRITQHMKIHTPRPLRKLTCKKCGKHFNLSSALTHHIKKWHKNSSPVPKVMDNSLIKHRQKEEDKRVVVELIENAGHLPNDPYLHALQTPPIAREETISAVNSIVDG